MEEKVENKNFFKKVWYSITKFEQYPTMAMEGTKRAIKYLVLLTAIASLFMMLCSLHAVKSSMLETADYIQNNIPDFTYSNGIVSLNMQETITIEDAETTGIDKIIINTLVETDEQKEQIKKDNDVQGLSIFFLNDRATLRAKIEGYEVKEQNYTYTDIITNFTGTNIQQFSKSDFIDYLKNGNMTKFYSICAILEFTGYFVNYFLVVIMYALEIALLGWITTIILRIKMRFKALYNMSAYAITLSTILLTVYFFVNYFTGFTIKEFQIAYIAIAYIYLAAAIFILKDDVIKKMQEVEKIKQEQLKVRQEIEEEQEREEQKENKEDKNEDKNEDKKEDNKGDEPQGSEV